MVYWGLRVAEPDARRTRAAGDKHSSHSDEELLDSLPNTYFRPVQCAEEKDARHAKPEHPRPQRPIRGHIKPNLLPPEGRTAEDTVCPDSISVLRHSRVPKTKATQLPGPQDDSSDESSAEGSCSKGVLGAQRRETRSSIADTPRKLPVVTRVPVDASYDFPRTELAAMSSYIARLIDDIDRLDLHRLNMMEELKVLRDITLYYNEQHPELRVAEKAPIAEDIEDGSSLLHSNTAGERAPTPEIEENSSNEKTTKST